MRHAAATVLLFAVFCPLAAQPAGHLTLVFDMEQRLETEAFQEMQSELGRLLEPAGIRIDFRMRSHIAKGESFDDLMVITLKGRCDLIEDPMLIDERGPVSFGYAHRSEGTVLPFAVVGCDAVRRAVSSALWGELYKQRSRLVGRALARVTAHELFHVIENEPAHSESGVFRHSLSGAQLISERFDFSPKDMKRLRRTYSSRNRPAGDSN